MTTRAPVVDALAKTQAQAVQAPPAAQPRLELSVQSHGMTDRGRVRPGNEDQFLVAGITRGLRVEQSSLPHEGLRWGREEGRLFVVADGMGGHSGGKEASALAVAIIQDFLLGAVEWLCSGSDERVIAGQFQAALRRADARVCEEANRNPALHGMGTTVTVAYSAGDDLFVAHAGDSRCYLLRGGVIQQLTRDHTLVDQLVQNGVIAPDQAHTHQLRHVVTNVVGGGEPGVRAELRRVKLQPGDTMLLCTDGLTGPVSDQEIAAVLHASPDPKTCCEQLVQVANARGGADNVTVVVARFDTAQ
jgi:serine/threonine protein phosphatase PrpC